MAASATNVLTILVIISGALGLPIEVDENPDNPIWIPNLRDSVITGPQSTSNLAITPSQYKIGDIVAELTASSGFSQSPDSDPNTDPAQNQPSGSSNNLDYEICKDPASKIILYPLDNFKSPENNRKQRPVTIRTEVFQFGRFDRGSGSGSFYSVKIEGSCCWETFNEVDFAGKMLRLCRGKYNSAILGRMAGNIKSLRPVNHFKKRF